MSRLATYIAFPQPVRAPDSGTYYSGEFLNFELVSLTGHAARGWVIPAIYSFMPNQSSLELVQFIFSAVVWTFLLVTIKHSRILNQKFTKYAVILLAILGSSAQVIQHDSTILATSIGNSLFVLLLALLIRIRYSLERKAFTLFAILLTGFLLSIQKTTFLPIAITITLLGFSTARKVLTIKVKTSFIVLTLLAGVLIISVGTNVNNSWQVSYSGQTLLWQLGGQSPSAEEFAQYLTDRGAPDCITKEAPFENLDTSIGKIINECPSGSEYIRSSFQKDFIFFALSNPVATAKLAIFGMGAAITDSSSNYGNAISILPRSFTSIFFGESYPSIVNNSVDSQVAGMDFLNSGKAIWLFTPILFWIIFGLFGVFISRAKDHGNYFLLAILAVNLIQAIFVVILLPSEWVRQTSPFVLGTLIISVVLTGKLAETIFEAKSNFDT
jgi:hypothetical protein